MIHDGTMYEPCFHCVCTDFRRHSLYFLLRYELMANHDTGGGSVAFVFVLRLLFGSETLFFFCELALDFVLGWRAFVFVHCIHRLGTYLQISCV